MTDGAVMESEREMCVMKTKLSGLSGAVTGTVIVVAAALALLSGSAAMILGSQGGGRPTPKPKPTPTGQTKRPTPRPRSTTPVSKANGNAAPRRNAGAGSNTNNGTGTRPRSTAPAGNASSGNTNAGAALIPPSTLSIAKPSNELILDDTLSNRPQPKPNPDADIILPQCLYAIDLESRFERKRAFEQKGMLSEISGKRKVFVSKGGGSADYVITARLREYSGLEIVETAAEAEFAVNYCEWYFERKADDPVLHRPCLVGDPPSIRGSAGNLVITIRDPIQHVPRVIWQADDTNDACLQIGPYAAASPTSAADRLTRRFISELKKLRGETGLLLPQDFMSSQRSDPEKPLYTTGEFAEILGKRKVFVTGDSVEGTIASKLRSYSGLEIVETDAEAEFAVHFYFTSYLSPSMERGRTGSLIITIRDPVRRVPRIIWWKSDSDGGLIKRGSADDKLVKRFISELKKLRGEK